MSRGAKPGERRGGRKKGTRNKRTEESIKAAENGESPRDFLLRVMREPLPPELKDKIDTEALDETTLSALLRWYDRRIDAAKAAAPFVHPKLSSVDVNGNLNATLHEKALEELA